MSKAKSRRRTERWLARATPTRRHHRKTARARPFGLWPNFSLPPVLHANKSATRARPRLRGIRAARPLRLRLLISRHMAAATDGPLNMVFMFPDKASREAVECRDAARILDVDPRLFRRLNNNALDADGRITQLSGWLVAPERLKAPCALCRCRGEIRAWRCRVERRHATPPYNDPEAQQDGMRVKVRVEGEPAKWKAALLIGDASQKCKVQFVGSDAIEDVDRERLCFLGAAPRPAHRPRDRRTGKQRRVGT